MKRLSSHLVWALSSTTWAIIGTMLAKREQIIQNAALPGTWYLLVAVLVLVAAVLRCEQLGVIKIFPGNSQA